MEKVDTHEGIIVKVLLDSSIMGMLMNWKMVAEHGFRLQKLKRLIVVKNINRTNNNVGAITYQVEANVYYESYIERIRMNVYDLGRIDIILGMPWLLNWETEEVKITRCPSLCRRNTKLKKKKREKE